jgi:uncharacterized membrane protein YvlD (DUF360 family)
MSFLIRLFVNAAALWVATRIVPGVTYSGEFLPFLAVALVFGIVNAFIGPVAKLLTLPLIILTLGIFALVVNGLLPRSRINAVRRLLRVRQRGGAARTDHPTACFQGAEQPTPASVLGSRPARTG